MMELPEAVIASQIAVQDLPKQRLIAVGKCRFWVQHQRRSNPAMRDKEKSLRKTQLWFLKRALENERQEKRIQRAMTAEDWEFFRDRTHGVVEEGPGSLVFLKDE